MWKVTSLPEMDSVHQFTVSYIMLTRTANLVGQSMNHSLSIRLRITHTHYQQYYVTIHLSLLHSDILHKYKPLRSVSKHNNTGPVPVYSR